MLPIDNVAAVVACRAAGGPAGWRAPRRSREWVAGGHGAELLELVKAALDDGVLL